MPLVAAGLPVLQALEVREDVGALAGVESVLQRQRADLGEGGVLELLETGGEQVVDGVGRLLGVAAEEPLQDEHGVGELTLLLGLPLVGEEVVAQVDPVGEGVPQDAHRPARGDGVGHLGTRRVLDEIGRPGCPADLAPHLDVLDGIGDPAVVDVGQLPHRLLEQVPGALAEAPAPAVRHRGDRTGPQVGQTGLHLIGRLLGRLVGVERHEQRQPVEVLAGGARVAGALELVEEVVVEEEDPHVPVRDEVELGGGRVGVGVGAQQGVVVGVEVVLVPDAGALDHSQFPGPVLRVRPGARQMGIEPGRVRRVEAGQLEGVRHRVRGLSVRVRGG